jgi:hypothetical protein
MKLQDLILHNFRLKLFSLLIALLVWETIHLAIRRESDAPAGSPPSPTNKVIR